MEVSAIFVASIHFRMSGGGGLNARLCIFCGSEAYMGHVRTCQNTSVNQLVACALNAAEVLTPNLSAGSCLV